MPALPFQLVFPQKASSEQVRDIYQLRALIKRENEFVRKALGTEFLIPTNFILAILIVEHFGAKKLPSQWGGARNAILDFGDALKEDSLAKLLYRDSRYNPLDKGLPMMQEVTYNNLRKKYPHLLPNDFAHAIRDPNESVRAMILILYDNRITFGPFIKAHPLTFRGKPGARLKLLAATYNCAPYKIMNAVTRAEEDYRAKKRKVKRAVLLPWENYVKEAEDEIVKR